MPQEAGNVESKEGYLELQITKLLRIIAHCSRLAMLTFKTDAYALTG
jgi:hypothetical protein